MKKLVATALVAAAFSATPAFAADLKMATKAPPAPVVETPWDIAFGSALMSDYIFRGVTQSAHRGSVAAYFEPRYNFNKDLQAYVGVAGESIDFPNRAAAEIDVYGGIRPTFGKLALDFGVWGYLYPGGQCFNTPALCNSLGGGNFVAFTLPNGNVIKRDLSFWEVYGKATYNLTDEFAAGFSVNYSPSVLNSGADGTFVNGNAKYTFPSTLFAYGIGAYVSGDIGHWFLGTSDAFYAVVGFPNGIPYKSYTTWDLGFGITWKKFTVDFRYYDTDLNKGDCNAFTSDHTASGVFSTPINPGGPASNWCGATFVVKGSVDLAVSDLK
ncbi:MAG TPA: TorF family putative porin [Gemmataceae bacterium]|nr:TorF family putative porin [Gemmataceae bacterium]